MTCPGALARPKSRFLERCRCAHLTRARLRILRQIDCHTRQLRGWHLSRSGKAMTAAAALEQALVTRYGTLGRVPTPFPLRSDNGLVFTSRNYTRLVRSYGLRQEFITSHCPQQNGMARDPDIEGTVRGVLPRFCGHFH